MLQHGRQTKINWTKTVQHTHVYVRYTSAMYQYTQKYYCSVVMGWALGPLKASACSGQATEHPSMANNKKIAKHHYNRFRVYTWLFAMWNTAEMLLHIRA